jgi:hypothetical protein
LDAAREARGVVPRDLLLQDEAGKHHEDRERDALLDDFQLIAGELAREVSGAIGGYHQAVFEEGDSPGNEDHDGDGFPVEPLELQVAVPGDRHEYVRADKEGDGFQGTGRAGNSDLWQSPSRTNPPAACLK